MTDEDVIETAYAQGVAEGRRQALAEVLEHLRLCAWANAAAGAPLPRGEAKVLFAGLAHGLYGHADAIEKGHLMQMTADHRIRLPAALTPGVADPVVDVDAIVGSIRQQLDAALAGGAG